MTDRRQKTTAFSLKGLFAVVVWGASFVATRIALETLNPVALVAIRLLLGAGLLAVILRATGHRVLPTHADRTTCGLLGVVIAAHLLLQARGLDYTSAINTGWIIGFIPVCIAVGAQLLGQQRLARLGWIGVAVGTAGVLLVTLEKPPDFAHARLGDLLQIASCLTWTLYTLASAGVIARQGALRVTTFAMGAAALLCTIAALGTGALRAPLTAEAVLAIAFLGLLCSGVGYYLWFAATHERGPTRIAALLYLEPFVTLAVATTLMNEPITRSAILGGLCVLLGVYLVSRGSRPPR